MYPGTTQVVIQQATVDTWNMHATPMHGYAGNVRTGVGIESRLLPFNFLNLRGMMTLGSDNATTYASGGRVKQRPGRKLTEEVGIRCKDDHGNAGTSRGGGWDGEEAGKRRRQGHPREDQGT